MNSLWRRCSSLKLRTSPPNFAIVLGALREKRATILAWFLSGAVAMYFEAAAIAAELREYPGGAAELAKSIMPAIEGMRIIRWPADRLDTLGGYLAYHNIVLFNYFLALFAAVQGARLIRHLEESGTINFYLSATVTRNKLIELRSFAYFISQIIISLGLGAGTALALAAENQSDTYGSFITLLAGGICIFPFFGAGLLISQFVKSSRTAAGITSILVTLIYIFDNIADKYSWLTWFKYLSPFHYANLSRPVIPGFDTNYWSWFLMLGIGVIFIWASIFLFNKRDISAISISKLERNHKTKIGYVPKSAIGDALWRQRYGLIAWIVVTTAFIGVFVALMSGVIDIWKEFSFLQQFAALGLGDTAAQQYLAMVYEVLPPFIAGFVISQSSKWTLDLTQGRTPIFLATPISMTRIILNRFLATLIGTELILLFALAAVFVGSNIQGIEAHWSGMWRVFVMCNLFALAFTAITALLVALLHGKSATQAISIYVGAAWMIVFMAPYLKWPSWTVRFSIFDAFGHPFVKWPTTTNFLVIATATAFGVFGSIFVSNRTAKTL